MISVVAEARRARAIAVVAVERTRGLVAIPTPAAALPARVMRGVI